ncbi:hypothetical protein [Gracilibacillus saliphilus]|nr:hypothetical protein [Gracilibacillus saliphilus]
MEILFLILIFAGIFGIYDVIRKVNNNILEQTEELKKIREQLKENSKKY